jgi:phosphate transport system substrate-binding protein
LDYQAIGSGNGVKQIVSRIVDFGASDEPMSAEELSAKAMPQFPTLIGGIVPVVNIRAVAQGQLKMSGEVLADIYLGKITRWNDPRVVAENKGLQLPDEQIAVVQRVDESGSALAFTSYLSQVSKDWKHDVGAAKAVHWPVGVGAKGNDGVANYVGRLECSIGFVEYGTVKQEGLAYVQLKNRDGYFVPPSETTLKAAASHAVWDSSRGFGTSLVNQPGAESWPITMTTFILLNNGQKSVERGKAVLAFFDWAFREGDQYTTSLGFVPLPEHVENLVREAWKAQVKDAAGNALWN